MNRVHICDDFDVFVLLTAHTLVSFPRRRFGGLYGTLSKYGDMDITGDGGMVG